MAKRGQSLPTGSLRSNIGKGKGQRGRQGVHRSMSVERQTFPQFFITSEGKCAYLPGRVERKVFTHLVSFEASELNDLLTRTGFRRSQNIAYRPACEGCQNCVPVRIPVDDFAPSRTMRKIRRRNADLIGEFAPPKVTMEHYELFRRYIDHRHGDGSMAGMTVQDFTAMVEETFVDTRLVTYRRRPRPSMPAPDARRGALLACALTDVHDDGLSMIYSFYDPDARARSPGTHMILEHVERARRMGLPYVYLGYWVPGSAKMDYKARFLPQDRLIDNQWVRIGR